MTRILFVCHGNICRSTMAQFVMQDMVNKKGLAHEFFIASAGTSAEELGHPVHRGTRQKLAEHGISCAGKVSQQLQRADYDRYDFLIGMDAQNLANMRRMLGPDLQNKVSLLLDFTGAPRDIADPWYTCDYDATYLDVFAGCSALLDQLCVRRLNEV